MEDHHKMHNSWLLTLAAILSLSANQKKWSTRSESRVAVAVEDGVVAASAVVVYDVDVALWQMTNAAQQVAAAAAATDGQQLALL